MPKIKKVYEYNNGSWGNETPIGADASNIDVGIYDSTGDHLVGVNDLQSVLGDITVSDASIKTQLSQISGKVSTVGGDIKSTVVSEINTASTTDTSENISDNASDVIVAAGESQYTMWGKFNSFRKRVSNKFNNFLISSVDSSVSSNTKTYSQSALNNYFSNVIGYTSAADVASVGSVANQLSTLNSYALYNVENVASVDERIADWVVYHWKFKHPNAAITNDHFVLVQTAWSSPTFSGSLANGWYHRELGPFHWPYVFTGTPNGYFNLSYWGTGVYWGSMRATGMQTFYLELFQNSSAGASGNGQIFAFGYI